MKRVVVAFLVGAVVLAGCSTTSTSSSTNDAKANAVVIVSGGGAVSPFTTPDEACSSDEGFLAAGNSDTALRAYLLSKGKQVYTAPAMDTWGTVAIPDPKSLGPFKDCPAALPESMTIMSAGDIDNSGEKLARFLNYLNSEYGVTNVDLVGHSNGGLFARSAIKVLQGTQSPIVVRSLTMLGTPNSGSVPGSYTWGEYSRSDCRGVAFCLKFNDSWLAYAKDTDLGLNREDTLKYLDGPLGWNQAQAHVLDDIPVTMLAGTFFTATGGKATMWPNDGITSRFSAWAQGVPNVVIPHRSCWEAPLTHSIFVSEAYNTLVSPPAPIDWQTSLTWNTAALARVNQAIDEAEKALTQPTGQGC